MRTYMTRIEILFTYLFAVTRWALFGALGTYVLLIVTFAWVAHTEGLSMSLLPDAGFFYLCMGVGAFIGGASGVEVGQEAAYAKERSMQAAARSHPSVR